MRISLVIPNVFEESRTLDKEMKEALGILYLASVLRENGHIVNIIEAGRYGLSINQTKDIIFLTKPDFVGFSVLQRTYNIALKISKLLRAHNFSGHICFGGYFPTLSPESLGDNPTVIDSYILGEGELTLLELVDSIDKGREWNSIQGLVWFEDRNIQYNQYRPKIEDIDSIPFPARDLLPYALNDTGYAAIISSRGCYGQYSFCTAPSYDKVNPGQRWRGRSPCNLVDEIELLVNEYGVKKIKFNDDNIFGPGKEGIKRVKGICEEIGKRNLHVSMMAYCRANDVDYETMRLMKEVGFGRVLIGIESINDFTLQKYNKGIQYEMITEAIAVLEKLDMHISPGFIMYDPYINVDGLKKNLDFLKSLKGYNLDISGGLRVTDNTSIQRQLQKEEKLIKRSISDGHMPFKVSQDVSKIYYINKLFFIYYFSGNASRKALSEPYEASTPIYLALRFPLSCAD